MIAFLNKGLILEQEIIQALKDYFTIIDINNVYDYVSLNITNDHPFAQFLLYQDRSFDKSSLFPAIVVTTDIDVKSPQLEHLVETQLIKFGLDDIKNLKSQGYSITDNVQNKLKTILKKQEEIYGISYYIRRNEHISIEIWSENIQIKNELYEMVRLFVCGYLRDYLTDKAGQKTVALFDNTIRGERSNNYNEDFGIVLSGGRLTFEVDYGIEQIIVDTELTEYTITSMEVTNHVKGYSKRVRRIIWRKSDGTDDGGSGKSDCGTDDGESRRSGRTGKGRSRGSSRTSEGSSRESSRTSEGKSRESKGGTSKEGQENRNHNNRRIN